MENQKKDSTAAEENKVVSRKSNEEIADDVADEVNADEKLAVNGNTVRPKKFRKNSTSNNGVED